MSTRFRLSVTLAWLFVAAPLTHVAWADDKPAADDPQEETKKLNELIEKSIDWYEVLPDAYSKTALRPQPVMRWRNAARGQAGEAMMVVWAHNGRPEAMASIYPWEGYLYHEFGSLSRAGKLVARENSSVIWSPSTAGVEYKEIPDAPPPAETPLARLRQMKSIADQFKATMTGWKGDDSDREELRLLPRPLYRYDLKQAKGAGSTREDGALFAFVMGTDPEAVMLLETAGTDDRPAWQYAFARATSGGLEARLDGKTVWTAEKYPANRGILHTELTVRRLLDQ